MSARLFPVPGGHVPAEGSDRAWLAERSDGARLHAGIDVGARGQIVIAPENGTIEVVARASYAADAPRRSAPPGWAGYGPVVVVLKGDSGYFHLLGHMSSTTALTRQRVGFGDRIGVIDRRANHLHWEVRRVLKPPAGVATIEICDDPVRWLIFLPSPWTIDAYGCPVSPNETRSTPRACRPGVDPASVEPIALDVEPRPGAPPEGPELARVDELDAIAAVRAGDPDSE